MRLSKTQGRQGFTIVELAVVIVVIGILAGIVLVAYPGIQKRAADTEVQGDLRQASMRVEAYKANAGGYPLTQQEVDGGKGLPKSDVNRTYNYTATLGMYCISAVSERSGKTFSISSVSTEITEGSCPVIIQGITNASCSSTRIRAVDARDNHTYWVQKLADGKCWMLTNLAYAGGGVNSYGDVKTLLNGTSDTNTSYTLPKYYIPAGANATTEPTNPSTSTNGTGQYGYLYNWCAAMGVQATAACANASTPAPVTTTSICPSGWRLPTGNGGEFAALNTAINGGSTTTDAGFRTNWLSQRGGLWWYGFANQGNYGDYWSSTQGSAAAAFRLDLAPSYVGPASAYGKDYAFSVRCLAI